MHNFCGIQDNKCVRVVRTDALCHGCLHILPRWPRRKSSQPQVQETNPLLERWVTHKPPTHQKCMILKRVITSSWSSRVTTASLPAPLTFFLPLSSFAAHIWLRIFSFISIPNAFQTASHWTTDRVNPEMNASANHRFLSRSQKRVCDSATFELAFSHSRRQVDAPFLPHVSCVPRSAFLLSQALRELVSPSDWAAAAAAPASAIAASSPLSHAHVQLQRQDDQSQPSEGRGGGSVKTNGLEKKLKLEADDSERQTDRFPCLCSVSAYFSACDRP